MDLNELMRRTQHSRDGRLLIGFDEVRHWPQPLLDGLLHHKIMSKVEPAQTLVCPGCEEACCRPIQTFPGSDRAFVVCDLRSDTGRVPIQLEQLQQWQLSLNAIYKVLSDQSGLTTALLQTLPIVWDHVFLFEDQNLRIDSDYLIELSVKLQSFVPGLKNQFVWMGDNALITFNQKTMTVRKSKGLRYIDYLIRNKGKEIHVSELFYAIDPPDVNQIDDTLSGMSEVELESAGLSIANLTRKGTAMTPESKRILQNRLTTLDEKLEDAIERGDEALQSHLEHEQETIMQLLARDFGLNGKTRNSDTLAEQLRKNTTNCINKEKKKLKQTFPEFAEHLIFIKTGTFCSYQPIPDTEWQ